MIKNTELLKRAIKWISDQRQEFPEKKLHALLDEAGRRFNLSPLQIDSLLRILKEENIT